MLTPQMVEFTVSNGDPVTWQVDPSQMVFIDAKALKKKLKEDLCKEHLRDLLPCAIPSWSRWREHPHSCG